MAAFEEIGLVHRSGFIDGTCLYEIDSGGGARYRVVCRHTRRVRDVDPEDASALAEAVRQVEETLRAKGFTEVGHIVEFFGTAPEAENAPA
jgi:Fur family ferric uptake transcriptional regulator